MPPIGLPELRDLVEWEKVREAERARIIELKKRRRVSVGPNLTFLFENRHTVLFQIQEMVRTERIVHDARIQEEIEVYGALLPDRDELSVTLFIEIPDLHKSSAEEVRRAVNRFQGLDAPGVCRLVAGPHAVHARFEEGHSKEEKMAAVQYLRFPVPSEARACLADPAVPVRIVVDHPDYRGAADLAPQTRAELLADLSG